MFFTRLCRVVAIVGFVLGVFNLALGLSIATGVAVPAEAWLARYTTAKSSGEVIDKALEMILVCIAAGTLAEIGLALRRPPDRQ